MELSIIIVNWHSADFVVQCLSSITAFPPRVSFEIIVVDNASFDNCHKILNKHFPDVRFIQATENLGFAKANNLGASVATGALLLFLNPDTVVTAEALNRLIEASLMLRTFGLLGALLRNTDRSIQTSCIQSFPTILNQLLDSNLLRNLWPQSRLWGTRALSLHSVMPYEVDAISGACMLTKAAIFSKLGGFSDNYFMYSEDIDLCYKAHLRGLINFLIPTAEILHHGGGSSHTSNKYFQEIEIRKARCIYFKKFKGSFYALFFRCLFALMSLARVLTALTAYSVTLGSSRAPRWRQCLLKWWAVSLWAFFGMRRSR